MIGKVTHGCSRHSPGKTDSNPSSIVHLVGHVAVQLPQVAAIEAASVDFQGSQNLNRAGKVEQFSEFKGVGDELCLLDSSIILHCARFMELMPPMSCSGDKW